MFEIIGKNGKKKLVMKIRKQITKWETLSLLLIGRNLYSFKNIIKKSR